MPATASTLLSIWGPITMHAKTGSAPTTTGATTKKDVDQTNTS